MRHSRLGTVLALIVAGWFGVIAPAQTCNCTCDALIPACQVISRFFMNESGGPPTNPTMYLTAGIGTVPPTSAEVRHANRFFITPGTTLTHVCIALKNPSGPAAQACAGGDSAYIFIAVHDQTTGLPGAFLGGTQTFFIVDPCIGLAVHHQLVAFSTPQTFPLGADVWVGVGYPTADVNIGHQGNRTRTGGASAVWIGGSLSQWYSYDDPQLGVFNGRAPIIRALELTRGGGRIDVSPSLPPPGLATDENGLSAQFQVTLAPSPPLANVTIAVSSTNPSEGQPLTTMLTFTPLDYNIPQTVTVIGQDDPLIDGPQPYQVTLQATSADACYNGARVSVDLTNYDNDTPCQLRWTRLNPSPAPTAREHAALAYDPSRNRVVLFGGRDATGTVLPDTWEFDVANSSWMLIPTAPGPVARFQHAMAYDAATARVILAGGNDGLSPIADAWAWNGAAWTPLPPLPGQPRQGLAACFNPPTNGPVFIGGQYGMGLPSTESWEYHGGLGMWAAGPMMIPPGGPQPRSALGAASIGGSVVMFGGEDAAALVYYGDTWEYVAGGGWNPLPIGGGPSARRWHAMSRLTTRPNTAALFGGQNLAGTFTSETWVFEHPATWTQHQIAGPSGRFGHAMAEASDRVVLFGGRDQTGVLGDTWVLDDPSTLTIAGPPDLTVQSGGVFSLAVTALGGAPFAYAWHHNGNPLVNGPRVSGAQSDTLTISGALLSDWGVYTVTVSNACGMSVTASAMVDVLCAADFNRDHMVTVQDIFDFLNAWFAGDPAADINGGGLSVQDIFDFLNLWFAGCP